MIRKGDNFEMVYAGGVWLCDDLPERVMAAILIGLLNGTWRR